MNDTPRTDALAFRAKDPSKAELELLCRDLERENARLNEERIEAQRLGMQAMEEAAALIREQDAKIKRMAEALRDFEDAAYGRGTEDLRERHAAALRDAGVGK